MRTWSLCQTFLFSIADVTCSLCMLFQPLLPCDCLYYISHGFVYGRLITVSHTFRKLTLCRGLCMVGRLLRLIILGPPGAGKGTISKRIATDFQLTHLASGDILRAHVARETETGKIAKDFLAKGAHVCSTQMKKGRCSPLYGARFQVNSCPIT